MSKLIYDCIIIGSGAGGATVAKELSNTGRKILLLEKGKIHNKIGSSLAATSFYDTKKISKTLPISKGGVAYMRTIMFGGSTIASCGNATRCLQPEFKQFGIELEKEFKEAEKELGVSIIDESKLSVGTKTISNASEDLGIKMNPMPKMIDFEKCNFCGCCSLGCRLGAKWTARNYLDSIKDTNFNIINNCNVKNIIHDNGKVIGVKCNLNRKNVEFKAEKIILAAGGLSTPVILQNSGINNAGKKLFLDVIVNVFGKTERDNLNQLKEPQMSMICDEFLEEEGFILSPFFIANSLVRFNVGGIKFMNLNPKKAIGIMCKTRDDSAGKVDKKGKVVKSLTEDDLKRLKKGANICKEILLKAGAKKGSFLESKYHGAHPGASASINEVVDHNLETKLKGLYVCDGSVLPKAPGLPPILTIVALAKKLSKIL